MTVGEDYHVVGDILLDHHLVGCALICVVYKYVSQDGLSWEYKMLYPESGKNIPSPSQLKLRERLTAFACAYL